MKSYIESKIEELLETSMELFTYKSLLILTEFITEFDYATIYLSRLLKVKPFVVYLLLFKKAYFEEGKRVDADALKTVLIVEDDPEIAGLVAANLEDLGLRSEHAPEGQTGLDKALKGGYALIILDMMLPRLDGISVCTRVREVDPYTPILMLTAKAEEIDKKTVDEYRELCTCSGACH